MDCFIRSLRDGSPGATTSLYVIEDDLASVVQELTAAVRQGRAQAQHVLWAALGGSCQPSHQTLQAQLTLVDCCPANRGAGAEPPEAVARAVAASASERPAAGGGPARATLLVLDTLSALLFWDAAQGMLLLEQLGREASLSAVLAVLHADMHAAWEVEEVRRLAAGTLAVRGLAGGSADPRPADGALVASLKRRSGRVRVETELYSVLPDGGLARSPAAPAGRSAAAARPPGECADGSVLPQAGPLRPGMRLTLTEAESAARKEVVLPWEHSQADCASQEDLQPAALPGQRAAPHGAGDARAGRGFILYERDSDNEDVDSDEDPDDELDI